MGNSAKEGRVVQQGQVVANWDMWTNSEEDQRLTVIERRIAFKEKTLSELRAEKRKIMMRAIRRTRRAKGKE